MNSRLIAGMQTNKKVVNKNPRRSTSKVQRYNNGLTDNGAIAHKTSDNALVDLFGSIAALRGADNKDIIARFNKAFRHDKLLTTKILFWARDVRGGAGERDIFRIVIQHLATHRVTTLYQNLHLIPFYGRWDDLLYIVGINRNLDQKIFQLIKDGLANEETCGLVAKWMPREKSNKYGKIAKLIAKGLGLSYKEYRQVLSYATDVIEQRISAGIWKDIPFDKLPSRAMFKYRKAFERNCGEEFKKYLGLVQAGVKTIKADTLYPYDLVRPFIEMNHNYYNRNFQMTYPSITDQQVLNSQWKALPNYMKASNERLLPMVDTSGSMFDSSDKLKPILVSTSLGMYVAERNVGPFHNAVLSFDRDPVMHCLNGDLAQRISQLSQMHWGMNTDIDKAISGIADTGIQYGLRQSEMPTILLIISDMQFDRCTNRYQNASQMVRAKFRNAGYIIPKIIFWNVNAVAKNQPVKFNENGVALVSGASPAIMKSILSMKYITPYDLMIETIGGERYSQIQI